MSCDRISGLPDCLITQILSYLPTKDSVKTSVLSKRWEFLWLRVPVLDLEIDDFSSYPEDEIFPSFIDNYLQSNHESQMQKFKIRYDVDHKTYVERFSEWIGTAVDRGIQHLDVETVGEPCMIDYMPQDIYKGKNLVSLKLLSVGIYNPEVVVSLPCLKILYLEDIWYGDDPLIMEKFISGCPVLEDFTLVRPSDYYNAEVLFHLCVKSQTLKRFHLTWGDNSMGRTDFSVVIDAPGLEYLSFKDDQSEKIVIKNLTSMFMIDVDTDFKVKFGDNSLASENFTKRNIIRDFLIGISRVHHMIISHRTIEVVYQYSKMLSIPKFENLYRLQATFCCSMIQLLLPVFLESCPNLKSLILDFDVSKKTEQIELSYVPQCLLSSLKSVELKELSLEGETWKNLARYFLENSVVLKKLILRFKDSAISSQASDIFMEIHTFTKLSRSCQITIH